MVSFILIFSAAIPAAPRDVPAIVSGNGLSATVRVSDPAAGGVGSGVVLGVHDGFAYILTAAHVLDRDARPTIETFTVRSLPKADTIHERGELLFRSVDSDLAVVRVLAGKREWASVQLAQAAKDAERADSGWAIGCDFGRDPKTMSITLSGKKLVRRADRTSAFFWEAKGETVTGRSGGPLLDREGRLLGICSGTQGDKSYYAYLDEIRAALKSNRLNWVLDEKAARKE